MLVTHRGAAELEAGLDDILQSPKDAGDVKLIVRRPAVNQREILEEAQFIVGEGLVGDTWRFRPSARMPDKKSPHPDKQVTVMNARAIALIAQDPARWALAGDQLFVDLDLSLANLPAGTRLQAGSAVLEVSAQPHTGCGKFVERFGLDALAFVNSPLGRAHCLRGINARVVRNGSIRRGDRIAKI